jgi:hypothetical protein
LRRICSSGQVNARGWRCNFRPELPLAWEPFVELPSDEIIPPDDWKGINLVVDDEGRPTGELESAIRLPAWRDVRFGQTDLILAWVPIIAAAGNPVEAVETEHLAPAPANECADRAPGRRGRKPGSGAIDDSDAVRKMLRLLAAGDACSVHDAARKISASMPQSSSQSRKADIARFRLKFRRDHGIKPPRGKTWVEVEDELNAN